jgi:hypothetical protein
MILPPETKIYCLVEYENMEHQIFFKEIQKMWELNGYSLHKSPIPSQSDLKTKFKFSLEFTKDVSLLQRALYYGFVNALNKGRVLKDPFLIIPFNCSLIKPIDIDFVNKVESFYFLSYRKMAKDGMIIKPNAATKMFNIFNDNDLVIDKDFSQFVNENVMSGLNQKLMIDELGWETRPDYVTAHIIKDVSLVGM